MSLNDQDKIAVAREYFMRADQGRADLLDLFHEDAEFYFPKFGFGFGRESIFEMVKGFQGILEYIQHDYETLIYIPSGDFIVVEGTSHGKLSGKSWIGLMYSEIWPLAVVARIQSPTGDLAPARKELR